MISCEIRVERNMNYCSLHMKSYYSGSMGYADLIGEAVVQVYTLRMRLQVSETTCVSALSINDVDK